MDWKHLGRSQNRHISHGVNEFTRRCQEALLLKELWAVGRLSAEDNGITRPNKTDCPDAMEAMVLCYDLGWEFSLRDVRLEGLQLVPRKATQSFRRPTLIDDLIVRIGHVRPGRTT